MVTMQSPDAKLVRKASNHCVLAKRLLTRPTDWIRRGIPYGLLNIDKGMHPRPHHVGWPQDFQC